MQRLSMQCNVAAVLLGLSHNSSSISSQTLLLKPCCRFDFTCIVEARGGESSCQEVVPGLIDKEQLQQVNSASSQE